MSLKIKKPFISYTLEYIYGYEKNNLKIIKPENALEMSFLINRKLYVQEWNVGLTLLEKNGLTKLRGSEFLDPYKIASIIPIGTQLLWIAARNGEVFIYNGTTFSKWNSEAHDIMISALINTAIRLEKGNIAIGTQNNGLLSLSHEGKVLRHLNKGRGILSRNGLSLYQDVHQNLWEGLRNGMSYIELSSPFSIITQQSMPGTG